MIPASSRDLSIDFIRFSTRPSHTTLSQNTNCRGNLPEMLAECSTTFPDIQEYYLFLALYISKINRRIKSFNKKWKYKRPYSGWAFFGLLTDGGYIYPTMMILGTVIPYLKKIQKIYESHDTPPKFCWHQHFFTGNQQILLFKEIQIYIAFWYIIFNLFNFSWVFGDFFNKPYNFDDVSKKGYPKSS